MCVRACARDAQALDEALILPISARILLTVSSSTSYSFAVAAQNSFLAVCLALALIRGRFPGRLVFLVLVSSWVSLVQLEVLRLLLRKNLVSSLVLCNLVLLGTLASEMAWSRSVVAAVSSLAAALAAWMAASLPSLVSSWPFSAVQQGSHGVLLGLFQLVMLLL